MYVSFELLDNNEVTMIPNHDAGIARQIIYKEIVEWAKKYNVPYKTKIHKYTLRLCLESDEAYTHFQMSWAPQTHAATRYSIIRTES